MAFASRVSASARRVASGGISRRFTMTTPAKNLKSGYSDVSKLVRDYDPEFASRTLSQQYVRTMLHDMMGAGVVLGTHAGKSAPESSSRGLGLLLGIVAATAGAAAAVSAARPTRAYRVFCDSVAMRLLRLLDPETAHQLAILAARCNLTPTSPGPSHPALRTTLWGLTFPSPVGLAAGFDKHGEAVGALLDSGFGFVEVGSVTPLPQAGNPKPRMFRLTEDRAVINRYGFNSDGHARVLSRLNAFLAASSPATEAGSIVGVNLGKNKTSPDAAADYVAGVRALGPVASYLVVNVSSPNTPGLRALQGPEELRTLLTAVMRERAAVQWRRGHVGGARPALPPLLLKIAPDLTAADRADVAAVAVECGVDGLVVSNTTIARPDSLQSPHKAEGGGLSGAPLKDAATEAVRDMYRLTCGAVPIVGVGGIASGRDAYDKIKAGASVVQVYSALAYEGPGLPARIADDLVALLAADGYTHIEQAIGADHRQHAE